MPAEKDALTDYANAWTGRSPGFGEFGGAGGKDVQNFADVRDAVEKAVEKESSGENGGATKEEERRRKEDDAGPATA